MYSGSIFTSLFLNELALLDTIATFSNLLEEAAEVTKKTKDTSDEVTESKTSSHPVDYPLDYTPRKDEKLACKDTEKCAKIASDKVEKCAINKEEAADKEDDLISKPDLDYINLSAGYAFYLMPKFPVAQIEEVTLLSSEDWKHAREVAPIYTGTWWLRDPDEDDYLVYAVANGGVVDCWGFPPRTLLGVRPAFIVKNTGLKRGDKLLVGNTVCTILKDDLVLSDTVIALHKFDRRTNNYDKSEIKQYINSDEFKARL